MFATNFHSISITAEPCISLRVRKYAKIIVGLYYKNVKVSTNLYIYVRYDELFPRSLKKIKVIYVESDTSEKTLSLDFYVGLLGI